MLSDLTKWQQFLTNAGIPFKVSPGVGYDRERNAKKRIITIEVGITEDFDSERRLEEYRKLFQYGGALDIIFDEDGKFSHFNPFED